MVKKIAQSMKWIIVFSLILIPLLTTNRYLQDISVMTFLWAGFASAWNLTCGYSKRLSIGHGVFLGIGAYTSTLLFINYGVSPWIGMLVGAAISSIAAFILGKSTLRLKGTFFVLSTIAFSEIIRIFVVASRKLTGGSMGLLIPFRPGFINMAWNSKIPFAVISWAYMILLLIICSYIEKSRFGYYLVAVGEDREAAETLGVHSTKVMVNSFVLSAFLTSLGGTIFAQYIMYIEPSSVMGLIPSSLQFILLGIIGGLGTAFGPFVGAALLIPLSSLLRGYLSRITGLHGFIYGLILLTVVLVKPGGIILQIHSAYQYLLKKLGLRVE